MTESLKANDYFDKIIDKYPYIYFIWITDCEGTIVKNLSNTNNNSRLNDSKMFEKLKSSLSFLLNSTSEQYIKTEKEQLKTITSIYDDQILFQTKINNDFYIHIISDSKNTNIEALKSISIDISETINLKELNKIYANTDN